MIDAYFQSTTGGESRPLHDPCVMLFALAPTLFGVETLPLSVDTSNGEDAGALTVDPEQGAPVDVTMTVNGADVLNLLVERITASKKFA